MLDVMKYPEIILFPEHYSKYYHNPAIREIRLKVILIGLVEFTT